MNSIKQKIPEGWCVKKLGDCCSFMGGGTPSRATLDFFNGSIPWVKTTDLNNSLLYKTEENISELGLNNSSCKIISKGAVCVAMYGGFNQIGRTCLLGMNAAVNQAITAIIPSHILSNKYLLTYLNFNVHQWKKFASSSRKDPNITKQDITFFQILLPPLPEQEKIAGILSCWDDGIEKLSALIEKKKIQKKALMQQLLTGKHRLKGFKEPWIDVDLATILQYEQPSKYLVDEVLTYNKSKIPVLTANKAFILGSTNDTEGVYNKGDCIIFDDFTTDIKYVDFPFKIKSSAIKILTPLKAETNLKFVFEQMKRIKYPLGGHKRYYLSEFQYLPISLPSPAEQKAIAEILSKADEEIELLNKKLEAFKQEKKALMQQLLTGKIRVKVN